MLYCLLILITDLCYFMSTVSLTNVQLKQLKGIGHQLSPVVIIGGQGLTANVTEEINRALTDHELIKVKIPAGSKEARDELVKNIAEATSSMVINNIGRVCLLLRRNPEANPKLSNLARYS